MVSPGEISGNVARVSEGIAGLVPGARVLVTPPLPEGGFAERGTVPAEGSVFAIPEAMPFLSTAALSIAEKCVLDLLKDEERCAESWRARSA